MALLVFNARFMHCAAGNMYFGEGHNEINQLAQDQ
jgi:hypothetical protein